MKSQIQKNIILLSMLILSLAIFSLSSVSIFAEEGGETVEGPPLESSGEDLTGQAESEEQSEPEEDIIVTGDAEAIVEVENVVNTNIVEPEPEPEPEPEVELEEVLEEEICEEDPCEAIEEIIEELELEIEEDPIIEIVKDNEVEVNNDVEVDGLSGDNEIESHEEEECEKIEEERDAAIVTGNINIFVGVVNAVNSNIIDSSLSQLLFNIFENTKGDLDISDDIDVGNSDEECFGECINIVNDNEGTIDNNVVIDGSSGDNEIKNEGGDSIILTGDVNIVADVFNILNSNIIGSNWTRLIINIFGNWVGDLILPGKHAMQNFNNQGDSTCGGCDSTNIVNSNEGTIENNIEVEANTGENEIQSEDGDAVIVTGDANVDVDVLNIANSNVTNDWFFLAINNFGNWRGQVFSLPPGFGGMQGPDGLELYNVGLNGGGGSGEGDSVNIVNENSGEIKNGIVINANTGGNSIESENGFAGIQTGDVNAMANVVNILNSNFTGSDALIGMINIFGSWEGDLAFGQPDLWIGESVVVSPRPEEGATVTYTLTFANQGDADATNVILFDDFDENYLSIVDTGGGVLIDNPGEIQWDLGTVPVGEVNTVSYTARINSEMPGGSVDIINQSQINGFEDDANEEDNVDSLSIRVLTIKGHPNPVIYYPELPKLEVVKMANVDGPVYQGTIVDYAIFITNNSDSPAYDVVVTDVLINGVPEPLNEQSWDLDHVFAHETIRIDYSVYIGPEVEPDFYTNTAQANGFYVWGDPIASNEASVTIEVIEGEVMGETTEGEETGEGEAEEEDLAEELEEVIEEIVDEIIGVGIAVETLPTEGRGPSMQGIGAESLAILIEEEDVEEGEIPNRFFLAAVGEFFSAFSFIDFLIFLLIILVIILVLLHDRGRKLEKD